MAVCEGKGSSSRSHRMKNEIKGGWIVNGFLFFLCGSQSLVIPWIPVILKEGGLPSTQLGMVLSAVVFSSTVSVCCTLKVMKGTTSGIVRRLVLLGMFFLCTVFTAAALALVPGEDNGFCSTEPTAWRGEHSSAVQNWHHTLPPDSQEANLPNRTPLFPNLECMHCTTQPSTETSEENDEGKAPTRRVLNGETTTGSQAAVTPIPSKQFRLTTTVFLETANKNDKTQVTEVLDVKSSTKTSVAKPSQTTAAYQLKDRTDDSNEPVTVDVIDRLLTSAAPGEHPKDASLFIQVLTANHDTLWNNTVNKSVEGLRLQLSNGYSLSSSKEDEKEKQSLLNSDADENDGNTSDYVGSNGFNEEYLRNGPPKPLSPSYAWEKTSQSSFGNLAVLSKLPPLRSTKVYGSSVQRGINKDTAYRDATPPIVADPQSWDQKGRWWKSVSFPPLISANVQTSLMYKDFRPPRGEDDAGVITRYRRYLNQPISKVADHDEVNASNTFWDPQRKRNSHNEKQFQVDKKDNVLITEENGNSPSLTERLIHGYLEGNKLHSYIMEAHNGNIQWTVAILIVLASLLGGGIETSVSRLWHCIKFGLPQERGETDMLETISSPFFQLPVRPSHRSWTGITSTGWISVSSVIVCLLCQMVTGMRSPFGVHAFLFCCTSIIAMIVLCVIPIPFGSIRHSSHRRPLSLYLDDEVFKEGLRRIGFHVWVLFQGVIISLPHLYLLLLTEELERNRETSFAAQTVAIIFLILGDSILLIFEKKISRKLHTNGLMVMSGVMAGLQCLVVYITDVIWVYALSFSLTGAAKAFLWMALKNNALVLSALKDQEKEAWTSWIFWRMGMVVGAATWPYVTRSSWAQGSFRIPMLVSAMVAVASTTVVSMVALLTRSRRCSGHRVYHTLDLPKSSYADVEDEGSDEEVEFDGVSENDWLVQRAKQDGIEL